MKVITSFAAGLVLLVLLAGCGGGSSSGGGTGRASFQIRWPAPSRLIPARTESITVEMKKGQTVLQTKRVQRLENASSVTVTFETLPVGTVTATATAYPTGTGDGTPLAQGSTPVVIQAGQNTEFTLTMESTVTEVTVEPGTVSLGVGQTASIVGTAKNAAGEVVLLANSAREWATANASVATVSDAGVITATGGGSTTVRFRDKESGTFKDVTVNVRQGDAIAFQAAVTSPVPAAGDFVFARDLDADGNPDVAVGGANQVTLLYGRADGTLAPFVAAGFENGSTFSVTDLADLNGDGRPDIVGLKGTGQVFSILNQGGRFWSAASSRAVSAASGVAAGNFTADNAADLAVSHPGIDDAGSVTILTNNGAGTFTPGVTLGVAGTAQGVASGDLDGDNKQDLAVSFQRTLSSQSGVIVFYGNGTGGFRIGETYLLGAGAMSRPVIADVTGDGKRDVLAGNLDSGQISVLANQGDGTLNVSGATLVAPNPVTIHVADFNQDGRPDVIVANGGTSQATVFRNTGGGAFGPAQPIESGGTNVRGVGAADFNKDGWPDLVTQNTGSQNVSLLLNVGQ